MEAMITATLSFARDASRAEAERPLDLASLLASLSDDAADAGRRAAYEGPGHLTVTGRPIALKRAFGNLIDNAIEYGGGADVTLAADEKGITVTVDDQGPGIPEAELERVFDAFHRLEPSRSRETGGVGLGLAVVRTVIRGHGGDVTLANRAEGGLRARVTLPLGD
jgi:signal transduction histidine kinase